MHDLQGDTRYFIDNLPFRLTQCNLVGNLKQAPDRLTSLAVDAPDSKPYLCDSRQNALDLLCHRQGREMDHDRSPNSSPDIRRTTRQVTALFVKSEVELLFKLIVQLAGEGPRFL